MQDMIHHGVLPTGYGLFQERQRLGKTRAEVAKAVQQHSSHLRWIEQRNRVLPPGWYPSLRALGMQLKEPVWPAQMESYSGADLHRDLRTCSGLQDSRGWLSKRLCISDNAVADVIQCDLPVPHSWLLKLAEMGAGVPAEVRMVLRPSTGAMQSLGMAAGPGATWSHSFNLPGQAAAPGLGVACDSVSPLGNNKPHITPGQPSHPDVSVNPKSGERDTPPEETDPLKSKAAGDERVSASARRPRSLVHLHWTEESGLFLSVSLPLFVRAIFSRS